MLWMNTVGPYYNQQETYSYTSLPFCLGSRKEVGHHHETIGEALQGVELTFSGIDIKFKRNAQLFAFIFISFLLSTKVIEIAKFQ